MKNALQKFKSNFDTVRNEEAGDVIQNVLIIAVFVIIVGVVGGILYNTINAQAKKTGDCITTIGNSPGSGKAGCK
jgi:hypothetical protein